MSAELSAPKQWGKPFPKGVSGNPGGKRKEVAKAEKMLAKLLPSACIKLQALLESDDIGLVVEAMKLLFKYTLTSPDKRATASPLGDIKAPQLSPELAARLASLDG
jgi:hypothetical protein